MIAYFFPKFGEASEVLHHVLDIGFESTDRRIQGEND